jgi:hypothetical protein
MTEVINRVSSPDTRADRHSRAFSWAYLNGTNVGRLLTKAVQYRAVTEPKPLAPQYVEARLALPAAWGNLQQEEARGIFENSFAIRMRANWQNDQPTW